MYFFHHFLSNYAKRNVCCKRLDAILISLYFILFVTTKIRSKFNSNLSYYSYCLIYLYRYSYFSNSVSILILFPPGKSWVWNMAPLSASDILTYPSSRREIITQICWYFNLKYVSVLSSGIQCFWYLFIHWLLMYILLYQQTYQTLHDILYCIYVIIYLEKLDLMIFRFFFL